MVDYNELNDKKRFDDIISYINTCQAHYNLKKGAINYLNNLKKNKIYAFCSDEALKNIIHIIMQIQTNKFEDYLNLAQELYKKNIFIENKDIINNFLGFYKIVVKLLTISEEIILDMEVTRKLAVRNYLSDIYGAFENKNIACKIIDSSISYFNYFLNKLDLFYYITEYIKISRKYYTDEVLYLNNIENLMQYISDANYRKTECELIINKQLQFDKKQAGIYEIDEAEIKTLETKIIDYKKELTNFDKLNSETMETLEKEKKDVIKELQEYKKKILIELEKTNQKQILQSNNNQKLETSVLDNKEHIEDNLKFIDKEYNYLGFDEEVINILGIHYVKKDKNRRTISKAIESNKLDLLKNIIYINENFFIISLDEEFNNFFNGIINEETINILGASKIANLCYYEDQATVYIAYTKNKLNLLKKVYAVNPNFFINLYLIKPINEMFDFIINDEAINELGINYVAKEDDYIQNTIYLANINNKLSLLKQLIDENPEFSFQLRYYETKKGDKSNEEKNQFEFEQTNKIFNDCINEETFEFLGYQNIAKTNKEQQITIYYFYQEKMLEKLKEIWEINNNFSIILNFSLFSEDEEFIIKNIINSCTAEEICFIFHDSQKYKKIFDYFFHVFNSKNRKKVFMKFTKLNLEEKKELINFNKSNYYEIDYNFRKIVNKHKRQEIKVNTLKLLKK